ncbi:MAG: glycoside hydrolase family 3 N-terminal domain-containing protein [Melioribacteraceae bacterium]|nr:glycoside hydrolase family 3 N-terminal domain-containing protein [Melioribacteraceae bacterium]
MIKNIHYSFLVYFIICSNILLNAQSLKEKIGQMVWTSFTGTTLHDTIKYDLQKRNLGGVILFAGSITGQAQIKQLTAQIKSESNTPPFIAVDQEGGRVARLNKNNGFDDSPTAYKLGTLINNEDSTRKSARTMSGWLSQSGFNVNLAPVADVNIDPNSPAIGRLERSYSQNPDIVFNHIKWFIEEFNKKKIITCLKHFPGHGSALQDSHYGFTDISNTWSFNELIPYQSLIADNYNNMIMTGHLYNFFLDDYYPASLSVKVTTDLLRTQLGFKGVTITDGMAMQAITNNYSFEEAVEYTVNAGNDILLYTSTLRNGTSLASQIINIIEDKIKKGVIPLSRIEESYTRIIELKSRYGIITSIDQIAGNGIPDDFKLYQNYPNPFNPSTTISYNIPYPGYVTLKVYDILGKEVTTLVDKFMQPGNFSSVFSIPPSLTSGVYFYRLQFENNFQVKKMILSK